MYYVERINFGERKKSASNGGSRFCVFFFLMSIFWSDFLHKGDVIGLVRLSFGFAVSFDGFDECALVTLYVKTNRL